MSSILKALKKLEHDKTTRKPDTFRIDTKILQGSPQRTQISTGLILTAIALVACGAGATYLYMKNDTRFDAERSERIMTQRGKVTDTGVVSLQPETKSSVPSVSAERLSEKTARTSPESETKGFSFPTTKTDALRPSNAAETVSQPQLIVQNPTPPAVPVLPVVPATKTVFKVHGIAFQDGADSAAVVNGITVSVGSTVEDARVEDIQRDRVRFRRGGETFEVVLDKAN